MSFFLSVSIIAEKFSLRDEEYVPDFSPQEAIWGLSYWAEVGAKSANDLETATHTIDMWMLQMPRRLREAWGFPKRVENQTYRRVPGTVPPVHPRPQSPPALSALSGTSPSPPQSPHPKPFNFGRGCRPRVPRHSPSPPPPIFSPTFTPTFTPHLQL